MLSKNKISPSLRCIILICLFWVILLLITAYKCRFWISIDTIGALDAAREIRKFDMVNAISYWGLIFPLLLSLLPLSNPTSWFAIHLLMAFTIILTQLVLFKTLRNWGSGVTISMTLCLIWGASCYPTAGAIFLKEDIPLCLFAALYVYAISDDKNGYIYSSSKTLFLGFLHGIASLTKLIALPSLFCIPLILTFYRYDALKHQGICKKSIILSIFKFLIYYIIPLIIILSCFILGSYKKYGRLTLGDMGFYVYSNRAKNNDDFNVTLLKARLELPRWGTSYFSDLNLTLNNIDHRISFNFQRQIKMIIENIFDPKLYLEGFSVISIIIFGIISSFYHILGQREKRAKTDFLYWLPLVSILILTEYSLTQFFSRYIPFAAIFSLPSVGLGCTKIVDRTKNSAARISLYLFLLISFLHGAISMIGISFKLAPDAKIFSISNIIKQHIGERCKRPIGAYYLKKTNTQPNAFIAHILETNTAEITELDDKRTKFKATFKPETVLIICSANDNEPRDLTVNNMEFVKFGSYLYRKGIPPKGYKIVLYFKEEIWNHSLIL